MMAVHRMNGLMMANNHNKKLIFDGYGFEPNTRCWLPEAVRDHFDYSDGDEVERRIFETVRAANDLASVSIELARHITDWPTQYHLSPLRGNLLRPFENLFRGRVLEVGAGCGAITRFLGECGGEILALEGSLGRAATAAARCRDLPNVQVIVDAFDKIPSRPLFDVVTLVGVLEYARKYFPVQDGDPVDALLRHAQAFLKPDGLLVIAIENQLGLKYFAGVGEDHVGVSMYGIEDRYQDAGVVTFGRRELCARLENAGLPAQDWWFPFPDYKLPTVVVSENALKGTTGAQLDALLGPSLEADAQLPRSPLFMLERAWKPVVRNGLGADLANSFLVFAGMREFAAVQEQKDVAYHFAVERKPEYAKAVVFSVDAREGLTVRQKRLFPEFKADATAPIQIRNDIREPFIEGRLWSQELKNLLTTEGWTQREFNAWARRWFAALLEYADLLGVGEPLASNQLVPGSLLDAVPRNLIVAPSDKAVFFDQEFLLQQPLELGFMVFRGIYLALLGVGRVAPPSTDTSVHGVTLLKEASQALGLGVTEADLARYCALESEIQAWVSGRYAMKLEDVLSFSLNLHADAFEELRAQLDESRALSKRLEAELDEATNGRLRLERENAEQRAQLMALSNWAAYMDTHPFRYAFKKNALGIARGTLRSLPVSTATKLRLRDIFFSTIRPFRQATPQALSVHEPASPAAHMSFGGGGARDVFVFAVIDWHFRIQRPQHIARSLAEGGRRVFYISNHFVDAVEPGFQFERLPGAESLCQIKLHVKGAPSIYFEPPSEEVVAMLEAGMACVIQDFNVRASFSIVHHAFWYPLVKRLPESYRIYDCMDHHEGFGSVPEKLVEIEKEMLGGADLVTVTSTWLEDFARKYNTNVALVRNAAEYTRFVERPAKVYIDKKGRRIIGYYGAIAEWFDVDLVRAVALAQQDCLVLLVGNDTVKAKKQLVDLPNVEFTGEVPYSKLPFYLHAFDVCLLPFKVMPLTLATNPVKVYEYLSAGKPVVAVDLPEMAQFDELVYTAKDQKAFLRAVKHVLAGRETVDLIQRRKAFAATQTWEHRAAVLLAQAEAGFNDAKVSVIIVTFNNLELTKTCLGSLDKYNDYGNVETIVVDNASADGSPEFLRQWAAQSPRRKVILNAENRGFAAANNQGLAAATGDYLVLLNNDTHVTPGWLRTLIGHLRRDASIGLIGPVTNNIGNEAKIEITYGDMAEMLQKTAEFTRRHAGRVFPLRTAAFFCVMMTRSTYEQVGPLDEAFGKGFFEDDDYCRRIEQIGKRIVCAEDVFVHHHLSASFDKLKAAERKALFEKNKALYEGKWGAWIPHAYRAQISVMDSPTPPAVFDGQKFLQGVCNICGKQTRFFFQDPALYRESLNCEHCRSTSRYRSIARGLLRAIERLCGVKAESLAACPRAKPARRLRVYDTQPPFYYASCAYPIPDLLKKTGWIDVELSQYKPNKKLGIEIAAGVTNQNLECLTFADESFDVVVTSDVMEHVRLDDLAHREIYRVLKPGGYYLFTVPHYRVREETLERVKVMDPADPGKDVHLLDPEYHGDTNSDEDGDVLSYRVYGTHLDNYLSALGFVVEYCKTDFLEMGVANTELYFCRKRKD